MFRSTGYKTLYSLRSLVCLFVLSLGSDVLASVPASLSSGVFNKVVAVLTDLSFRQDKAYNFLVPNKIMAKIHGPETEPESIQRARSVYQTSALQDAMTTGIVFYQASSNQLACLDSAAEMQALYNYNVFPLNQVRSKQDLSSTASCLVAIQPEVENQITLLSPQQPLNLLLKSVWADSLRVASCPFEKWTKENEGKSGQCKANDAYQLGKKALKDEIDALVFFEYLPASYGLSESLRGLESQLLGLKKLLAAYPAGVQSTSGENVCTTFDDASSSFCAVWLKDNWLSITNPLGETLLTLKAVMQSVLAGINYNAFENSRSIEKRYSIEGLLNPNGYAKPEDKQSAVDLVTVLANAAQLPSILLPDIKPVSYDAVPGRCSNKNIFYYSGGQIGGDYSMHAPGVPGDRVCGALPFTTQSKLNTKRTEVYMDMIKKSEKFKKNMRTLVSGQTLFLSNFYDAISRRSVSHFIRHDWRSVAAPASRGFVDKSASGFQAFDGGWQAKEEEPLTGKDTPTVGDGLAWHHAMEAAAPSVVQRETLFTIADIIAAMYQIQEIQEKKLLAYSFQALQFLSGSQLVTSGYDDKDRLDKALGRYATGSPAWEVVGNTERKQKDAVQEILGMNPDFSLGKYATYQYGS